MNIIEPKPEASALRDAAALIVDPKNWCQLVEAVNVAGSPVHASSGAAVAWCAVGALHHNATNAKKAVSHAEQPKHSGRQQVGGCLP